MIKTANPTMITLARELRGIRQKELADNLGITQAAVSKMETGQILADEALIQKIAQLLDYPPNFFYEKFEIYPAPMQFYRKHKTLPGKFAKQVEAALNVYRLHVGKLLQAAEIGFIEIPECDIDEYGSAAEVARAIRQYLHIPRGAIESVIDILESLGIVVIPFDAGTRLFSGVTTLLVNTENLIIMINSQMPPDRLRWTLAHELGHIVMHRLPSATMEEEADEFAGEFLMPYNEIVTEMDNLSVETLASLKRHWKVSMSGILMYAHRRGLISDWKHKSLRIELAYEGITRTQEPILNLKREIPTLLDELIDYHLNELHYSVDQISEILNLYPTEFLQIYNPDLPELSEVKRPKIRLVR